GEEMRQLVEVVFFVFMAIGLWFIWADVMPAAQKLSNQPIESLTNLVAPGSADNSAVSAIIPTSPPVGKSSEEASSVPIRTSLTDVILAIAAGMLTLLAARRIPGALQFVLSSQMALDPGLRFALGTITRYLII